MLSMMMLLTCSPSVVDAAHSPLVVEIVDAAGSTLVVDVFVDAAASL